MLLLLILSGLSSKEAWLELLYMWYMIRGC